MEYQALITKNKKFAAELELEMEDLRLLQEEHLEYVTDIDKCRKRIDKCRENIDKNFILNKEKVKKLKNGLRSWRKRYPV